MKTSHSRTRTIWVLIVISCLLSACALQSRAPGQTDLSRIYNNAIRDAETAEPHEVSRNLVAIVPSNNKLVWKGKEQGQNPSILVVTWTNYDGYDAKVGQGMDLTREIWVTTVPELKNFCKNLAGDKTLRLEQLLGLPPKAGKTKFVEMWVKPADLFRPCSDPEISDCEAEIDFRTPNSFIKVSDEYMKWFSDLKMKSYGSSGYPWTRLGYTYDWGNTGSHIGLSEFVIMKGSHVEIHSVSPTLQYCQ